MGGGVRRADCGKQQVGEQERPVGFLLQVVPSLDGFAQG